MSGALRRSERRVIAGWEQALTSVARPWPTTVLWRWRYEAALLALALLPALGAVFFWTLLTATAVLCAVVAAVPSARRFAAARAWCVITPHRVRSGCAQARIHSRQGRLPAVLLTRPEAFGERVWLWCPAGTSAEDFESARAMLAAACWAVDVRTVRDPRRAHLVALDVVRRDAARPSRPLAARALRHRAESDLAG